MSPHKSAKTGGILGGVEARRPGRRSAKSIGVMGLVVMLMAVMAAFFLDKMPLIGAANSYTAEFSEAAGLHAGNEVRIAGVRVGQVTDVKLGKGKSQGKVLVTLRTQNAWVGDQTSASIQIKTVLGQKYVQLDPKGGKRLDPDQHIVDTTSPYDVIAAVSDATTQMEDINQDQVANSLNALSGAFSGTPDDVRSSLDGVTRLSETIASRDQELQKLLDATAQTTGILADRTDAFQRLIAATGDLMVELNSRQDSISALLDSTQALSTTLSGIVADNNEQIGPTLTTLRQTVQILQNNREKLTDSINLLAPFYKLYANVFGNGRWMESVVTNLTPPGFPVVPPTGRDPIRTIPGSNWGVPE